MTDVEWRAQGLLFVFQTAAAMDHYAETDRLLRDEFDLAAVWYDGEALRKLEPSLRPDVAGAWHYRNDGHLRPDKLMSAWRRVLESQGVEILEDCELLDATVDGGQSLAVRAPSWK